MATIKYQVKENNTLGTHSFYANAVSYSTLNFEDLADDVVEGLGISPSLVKTVLDRYMLVAKRNVLRGHRVKFGDLLTIFPQLSCSVKDEVDDDGNVIKPVTIDMFNLSGAKSSIGATISQGVQQSFAASVSWKRVSSGADTDETPSDDGPTNDENPPVNGGDALDGD
jgi:hypothetical protein